MEAKSGTENCWECSRRHMVCDAARPVCERCRAAGIVCPGYSDSKPLTWLAPGKVTSRTRRSRRRIPFPKDQEELWPSQEKNVFQKRGSAIRTPDSKRAHTRQGSATLRSDYVTGNQEDKMSVRLSRDTGGHLDTVAANSSAHHGSGDATVRFNTNPFGCPSSQDTDSHLIELHEAVEYYNRHIYPTLMCSQIEPSPFIVPVVSLSRIPNSMRHAFISMTMSHKLLQLPSEERGAYPSGEDSQGSRSSSTSCWSTHSSSISSVSSHETQFTSVERSGSTSNTGEGFVFADDGLHIAGEMRNVTKPPQQETYPTADMLFRLHHHTGQAIRHLTQELAKDSTRFSDATLTSVIVLLFAELQQNIAPHWRPHIDGLVALVVSRGGLKTLMDSSAHLKPVLLSFIIVVVMADTTSPPCAEKLGTANVDTIGLISELYSIGVFPSLPCPPPLFLNIIQINFLRLRTTPSDGDSSQLSASTVLDSIIRYDVQDFATNPSEPPTFKERRSIADIFRSSVLLYGIATLTPQLQSCTLDIAQMHREHRLKLFNQLDGAMLCMRIRKGILWPLIVAGVEAAHGSTDERAFVDKNLCALSRETGASCPLAARECFHKFWTSGKTSWDACFDQPHAMLI